MTPLSKQQFRWPLVLYCLLVAASFATSSLSKPLIPKSILDAQETSSVSAFLRYSLAVKIAVTASGIGVLLAGIVGIVGMFFLSRVAVYVFLGSIFLRTVLSPLLYSWPCLHRMGSDRRRDLSHTRRFHLCRCVFRSRETSF